MKLVVESVDDYGKMTVYEVRDWRCVKFLDENDIITAKLDAVIGGISLSANGFELHVELGENGGGE